VLLLDKQFNADNTKSMYNETRPQR